MTLVILLWTCPSVPMFLKNVISQTGHKAPYEDEPSVDQKLSPPIFRTLCSLHMAESCVSFFLADVSVSLLTNPGLMISKNTQGYVKRVFIAISST